MTQLSKDCKQLNKAILFFAFTFIGFFQQAIANNIVVSNTTLNGQDITAGANSSSNFAFVQFDLSWANSWRATTPANWDAAWVFVKFRLGATNYLSAPGASSSGTTITVQSTNGLRIGMPLSVQSGVGAFQSGTVITSIPTATTFLVNLSPSTPLSGGATVVEAERIWEHAWLNNSGHVKGSLAGSASLQVGLQDEASVFHSVNNPAMGAYLYRAGNGNGNFNTTGAKLRWNYGQQGIRDQDIVDVKVFAVEMVNVPTGTFAVDTALHHNNTSLLIDGDGTNGAQNNTFLDGSSNNFTITRFGNTTQGSFSPFCGTGGSGYFDRSGDYLSVPDNAAFDIGSSNFSMESWVYLTNFPSNSSGVFASIIACQDGTSSSDRSWVYQLSGTSTSYTSISITLFTGGNPVGTSASFDFLLNTWYHVAVVRSGTSVRLYVNGSDVGGGTNSTTASNSASNITIGAENPAWHGAYPYWFPGYISNLRILKGTAVYTANFTPPTAPLSAVANTSLLLNFENASIDDNSRRINIETLGNAQTSTTQSKFGGSSMAFDGTGDGLFAAPSTNLNFNSENFTIEFWIYYNSLTGFQTIVSNGYSPSVNTGWLVQTGNGNGKVNFYMLTASSSTLIAADGGSSISTGTWYHIAIVRNGTTTTVYRNGTSVGSGTDASVYTATAANIYVGGGSTSGFNNFYLNGYIDDFRITKGTALYTSNFTPPASAHSLITPNFFALNSENQLTLGETTSNLQYRFPNTSTANDFNVSTTKTLPAAFPKGYNGFYAMKYQIGQNQWLEFFNSLSSIQKTARDITDANGKNSDAITFRNNLNWSSGAATLNSNTHGAVACNYLSWMDGIAYADWAGLRPITELEYEKASRGTVAGQSGESATGQICNFLATMTQATGLSNSGSSNETASNGLANAAFGNHASVQGPMRVGAYATGSSSRSSAGASFYGLMELSGNLWEQVVTFGNTDGRNFTAVHGNGALTTAGHADVSAWPGYVSTANTGAAGSGRRGGSWEDVADRLRTSDRFQANSAISTRNRANGFRAVRSLPSTSAQ